MEMPQRSINRMMSRRMVLDWLLMFGLILTQQLTIVNSAAYGNEKCNSKSHAGVCKVWSECPVLKYLIESGEYSLEEVVRCGFSTREEIICCPIVETNAENEVPIPTTVSNGPQTSRPQITQEEGIASDDNKDRTVDGDLDPSTDKPTDENIGKPVAPNGFIEVPPPPPRLPLTAPGTIERPAIRACKRITEGLRPAYVPHILGGTDAKLGEFPHMVAIGFTHVNAPDGPYYARCGGSLIDTRFVLTAAHCFGGKDYIPKTVIMGAVDFSDAVAWNKSVVIRIKEKYIHQNYLPPRTYNDIAIVELEEAIPENMFIHPVCLYTDEAGTKEEDELWVSGWGVTNTTTNAMSQILLKAAVHVTPLEHCNASFVDSGLTRHIRQGIIDTQLCAKGKEEVRDACQGDSGGPLNLMVDEAYRDYRLLGVVAAGFSCGDTTPGLYTRVSKFVDFIEGIVWPNGAD